MESSSTVAQSVPQSVSQVGVEEVKAIKERVEILRRSCELYQRRGRLKEALEICKQYLIEAKKLTGTPEAEIIGTQTYEQDALQNLANVHRALGLYQEALALYQQIDGQQDPELYKFVLHKTGYLYGVLGQYQQQLETYLRLDEKESRGLVANVYVELGQYQKALEVYKQQLSESRKQCNSSEEAEALNNVGKIHTYLGQSQQAIQYLQFALKKAEASDYDSRLRISSLINLATAYNALGQYPQALTHLEQALAVSGKLRDRLAEGQILGLLGTVHANLNENAKSLTFYQQALATQQETGDRPGARLTLSKIAFLLERQKQPEIAIVFYKESINIRVVAL